VSIWKHGIQFIIDELLSSDWEEDLPVPLTESEDEDCVECYNWSYGDYKTLN
jgi:putative lipase involved disintegration of autophagic bodies